MRRGPANPLGGPRAAALGEEIVPKERKRYAPWNHHGSKQSPVCR